MTSDSTAPPQGVAKAKLALCLTAAAGVVIAALVDPTGLETAADRAADLLFASRGWFVMATVSALVLIAAGLAASRYGRLRLGPDDSRPDFSRPSWLAMLFAAGMGVGLLFWATAEPLSHFAKAEEFLPSHEAASRALFITQFNWGLHAWAIYAMTALALAYATYRKGLPMTMSAPVRMAFAPHRWVGPVSWLIDLMALFVVTIGMGGSIAMGVFQIVGGVDTLVPDPVADWLAGAVLGLLILVSVPALIRDLSHGMAVLSNLAMGLTLALMVLVLLTGPTGFLMATITQSVGEYAGEALVQGFRTYSIYDPEAERWFQHWTLSYMIWWLAWAPFVGVFIARISRGRTLREFLIGAILGPAGFSLVWFGLFGGIGFFEVLRGPASLKLTDQGGLDEVTFKVLQALPLALVSQSAVVLAAFLFVVTSLVSAAFVLAMLSARGELRPSARLKLLWGVLAGAMGLGMISIGTMEPVKRVIAIGAMPFVFVLPLLMVAFLRTLTRDENAASC